MKKVFKYVIAVTDQQIVMMPAGAQILTVKLQNGQLCLWALVDPEMPEKPRRIYVHGTGHDVRPDAKYIGTVMYAGDSLVFHVFEA